MNTKQHLGEPEAYWNRAGEVSYAEAMYSSADVSAMFGFGCGISPSILPMNLAFLVAGACWISAAVTGHSPTLPREIATAPYHAGGLGARSLICRSSQQYAAWITPGAQSPSKRKNQGCARRKHLPPSSAGSSSRCIAMTTSVSRSRTRWPGSKPAPHRSSAPSTASESGRATQRSKRS